MLARGPIEIFSTKLPVYSGPSTKDDGLLPIDVLYGRYIPEDLRIEIFVDRIRADAPRFGAEYSDLLTIVRIHEYAHAVVHMGIHAGEVSEQLRNFGVNGITDWVSFQVERNKAFSAIDDESGELLAQAITWACVSQQPASSRPQRLIETFTALEQKQPDRYRLPPEVRQRARLADWPLILRVAQGELDIDGGPCFKLADGLAELIGQTAEPQYDIGGRNTGQGAQG
jgi:hypothetical protein